MTSKAPTVTAYLNGLPDDRRATIEAVLAVIRPNLDPDIAEGMSYGMIGYFVPHSVYPPGYHCDPKQPLPVAGLASQKGYCSLYLMSLYMDPAMVTWFESEWAKTGKKLNMGKSCIRFKTLDDLPLDLIANAFRKVSAKKYIAFYEKNLVSMKGRTGTRKPEKKAPAKAKATA
jgi:hypothetical protein